MQFKFESFSASPMLAPLVGLALLFLGIVSFIAMGMTGEPVTILGAVPCGGLGGFLLFAWFRQMRRWFELRRDGARWILRRGIGGKVVDDIGFEARDIEQVSVRPDRPERFENHLEVVLRHRPMLVLGDGFNLPFEKLQEVRFALYGSALGNN